MDIENYYKFLNISNSATDEEITASYKKLAYKFHPDKNPHRLDWANDAMTKLNLAYTAVMSHRFKDETPVKKREPEETKPEPRGPFTAKKTSREVIDPEILTGQFIQLRETAKDALYRYFQYSLNSIPIREKVANRAIFNKMVFTLRKTYHAIRRLKAMTDDRELIEHFDVFSAMIYDFYRASECLNIIDSYNNQYDVEAYRIYRKGDEQLHLAHKEIFYDRHNRGQFRKSMAYSLVVDAEKIFMANLKIFPESSWAIETKIKLEYTRSLRKYVELFYTQ
jgi:curved DNA-binding protein CbpA